MNRKDFKEKYWKDPVWSKVISFIIITTGSGILTTLYIWIVSVYQKVSFSKIYNTVLVYFKSTIAINTFIFWIGIIVLSILLSSFFYSVYKKIQESKKKIKNNEIDEELPRTGMTSTAMFSSRLSGAFPGQRGFEWYKSREAVKRLEKLFEPPLRFEPIGERSTSTPFWWFRAGSSMYIDEFKKISKSKVLIGIREFKIKRIGVFVSQSYYKSFIYVETSGEKQTGLYNYTEKDILNHIETFGYASEEYAIFNNKTKISREHYDDGATIINGKIVDTFGSQLRVRFLTDYNFVIAANQSPFNSRKFDIESRDFMNKILIGEIEAETFIENLKSYNQKEYV